MKVGITNNQNFTSVIPVKVFFKEKQTDKSSQQVDEQPLRQTIDPKKVNCAFKQLRKAVTHPRNAVERNIANKFIDRDTSMDARGILAGQYKAVNETMQLREVFGRQYIFTGIEAKYIAQLSDKVGEACKRSYIKAGHADTYEVMQARGEFVNQMRACVGDNKRYLKQGNETLGLHINMVSEKGELKVEDIKFCRIV